MKTNKQITIDVELMEKLRGLDNASALINRLLKEYFEIRSDKSSLLEEKLVKTWNNLKSLNKNGTREVYICIFSFAFRPGKFRVNGGGHV